MAENKTDSKKDEPTEVPPATYKRLYRSCSDRMLGGVAGGLAEYFDIDSTLVRLLVLLLVFTGAGFLFYILAWIVVPEDPNCSLHNHQPASNDLSERANQFAGEVKDTVERNTKTVNRTQPRDGRAIGGLILVGLGSMFLLQNWFDFDMGRLWPVILIVIGVAILVGRGGRR